MCYRRARDVERYGRVGNVRRGAHWRIESVESCSAVIRIIRERENVYSFDW